jgi:peroxiredoxin Q/BCP
VATAERAFPQRWTFIIGKDGRILEIDKKVNCPTHATDLAAKLAELGVAKKQ